MSRLLFGHRNEILCIVPTISTIFCLSKCLMFKKGLQHLDIGFGHALTEQVLDICLEKGGQCPKVHVEHSRFYAGLLFNLLLGVQGGKLIVRTKKGAMRDVK
jgi:hypothetical protein